MDTKREGQSVSLTLDESRIRRNRLNRVLRFEAKARAVEYMGGACSECGGTFHQSAFDFHHTNPEEKDVDPGSLIRRKEAVLYAELDKCVLLCANCHRIHHWSEANRDTDWDERPMSKQTLTMDGETKTVAEWADVVGIRYETVRARVNDYGWDVHKALNTPVKKRISTVLTIEAMGKSLTAHEWSRETGIPSNTIRSRYRLGWPPDKIVTKELPARRSYGKEETS